MSEAFFERADAAVRGWLFRRTKTGPTPSECSVCRWSRERFEQEGRCGNDTCPMARAKQMFRRTKTDQAFALAEALDDARKWEAAYEKEAAELTEAKHELAQTTQISLSHFENKMIAEREIVELKKSIEDLTAAKNGWRDAAKRHMNVRAGLQDDERQRWAERLKTATRQRDRHALVAGICAGLFVTAVTALAILLLGPFGLH